MVILESDVRFGRNVKLAGTVILIASPGDKLFIPDGSIFFWVCFVF